MNVEKSFIDLSDIIRYTGNGTRPYMEGERVYKANHIIFCGLAKESNNCSAEILNSTVLKKRRVYKNLLMK